jgi:hypothetical protein
MASIDSQVKEFMESYSGRNVPEATEKFKTEVINPMCYHRLHKGMRYFTIGLMAAATVPLAGDNETAKGLIAVGGSILRMYGLYNIFYWLGFKLNEENYTDIARRKIQRTILDRMYKEEPAPKAMPIN